jgi:SAM-dependent methyltransferase
MIACNNPVFSQKDFETQTPPDIFFKQYHNPFVRFLKKIRPDITLNYASKKNYAAMAVHFQHHKNLKILVIGGSIDGEGITALKNNLPSNALFIESDVAHGPNTSIIFDSHQVPFNDGVFDLVIVQAVLEHVLDPFACVAEIYRVLKDKGMVYAETPFMQQVHGGQYDFHRFTHLGHRRLFRHFTEHSSGLVAGAGSSLAWSMKFFITSFASTKKTDRVLSYIASFLVFWVKYADYFLKNTRGSFDAACGYFFWGQKEPGYTLADADLLKQYKGLRY